MLNLARRMIVFFIDFVFDIIHGILKDIFNIFLLVLKKPYYPVYSTKYRQMLLKVEQLFRKIDPTQTYPALHTSLRRSAVNLYLNNKAFDPDKDIDEYLTILDQFPNCIEVCMAARWLSDRYLRHDLEDSIKGFHYCYHAARRYLQAPSSQRAPTTIWWRLFARFDVPIIATSAGSCIRILQWYLKQSHANEPPALPKHTAHALDLAEVLGMDKDLYWSIYHEVLSEVRSWTSKDTHPPLKLRKRRNTDHQDRV
jgi:hypothetical protein